MRKARFKEREETDDIDEDDDEEVPTEREVLCNSTAFIAITCVIIGELLNENNLWAVLIIGGSISALNIVLTMDGLRALARYSARKKLPTTVEVNQIQRLASGDVTIDVNEIDVDEAAHRKHRDRRSRREKDRKQRRRDEIPEQECHRREKEKKEDRRKRNTTRKERLDRREKRERRSRKKRRTEEKQMLTIVEV